MSACPDENTLMKFANGGAAELPALEAHLDGCEDCRRAIAAAASELTLPTSPLAHNLSPGQRIGRYEIERELGRGGMGIVYQARDVTLDRRVALKLLHARRDEAAQARLLREAQVMAKLTHPNVVPVFELGEWKGDLYLVMELVVGVTLEQWLKRQKHSRSDILSAFIQAGRGLAAAHAAGVVHRDFKPANVLVGGDNRVRVTDFGLSRPGPALELPATESTVVTRDGTIVGTLAYMAPEQLDGKTADERSDQFSFCVSLVEALSGARPYEGENWTQLALARAKKAKLSGVPRQLRSILRKGLEHDPARRYTSLSALLNSIERTEQIGWSAVALTAAAAIVGGFYFAWPNTRAPAATIVAATQEPTDDYVPVVTAAIDLAEGTIVTMEMLQQRGVPSTYVTSSVVKPDAASYILGQKLLVPVQRGDMLLWSEFETTAAKADDAMTTVLVAARDIAAGSTLDLTAIEHREIPARLATASVLKPQQSPHVWGHPLKVSLRKGDLILWSQLEEKEVTTDGLDLEKVTNVAKDNMPALQPCLDNVPPEALAAEKATLTWNVRGDGSAFDVHLDQSLNGTDFEACFMKAIASMKFPKAKSPSFGAHLDFVFKRTP